MAAQQNLRNFTEFPAEPHAAGGQFDFIHTRYDTAIDTHKVGMGGAVMIVFRDQLESPNVITQLGSAEQAGGIETSSAAQGAAQGKRSNESTGN